MTRVKNIYPAVGDYAEALVNPEGRFATLREVRAAVDGEGIPVYVSGTGRVTFDVLLPEGNCRLTCFTSAFSAAQAGAYGQVLADELYVFNQAGEGDYYSVAVGPVHVAVADGASVEYGELCEGRRVVVRDGRFGYVDEAGRMIVQSSYSWAGDFCEGRAAVAAVLGGGTYMGLIDREGRVVVPVEYDDLSWDGSRFAYVDRGGRHGCLDRLGGVVIPLEYDWVGEFDHGFAVVCKEGGYGYVDAAGGLVVPGLVYRDALSVGCDGVAEVVLGDGTRSVVRLF